MNWVVADLLMFGCSVVVYLAVRKASLDKLPAQFNNLAMFCIPLLVFILADAVTKQRLHISLPQALQILLTATVLAYLGNAMSVKSIELAPNAGYSLILSKSYVVLTTLLAVPLFNAKLTPVTLAAIALIVGASALIITAGQRSSGRARSRAWVPLALGSFFCWAFLSLMAKHLISEGMPTLVFLTYVYVVSMACILLEMWYRKVDLGLARKSIRPLILIGAAAAGFNFFNFYAIGIAPNVGYVNATNSASIGAVTILSVLLFGDELTKRKVLGLLGILIGLVLLFTGK